MVKRKIEKKCKEKQYIIKKLEAKAKSSLCSKSKKTNQTP
jgi:hypothetical protein